MKTTDFAALPEGTTVLLRPTGTGSRGMPSYLEVNLADMGALTPLGRFDSHTAMREPGVPQGFRHSTTGTFRALTLTKKLRATSRTDDEASWSTMRMPSAHTALTARQVIGVWDDLREVTLTERREFFRGMAAAEQSWHAAEEDARAALGQALDVVRPAVAAAGLGAHVALSANPSPRSRQFTTEEVAQIILSITEQQS